MNSEIDALLDAGIVAHCAGNDLAASVNYSRVLSRSPHHAAANLLLMALAQDLGDWPAAKDFSDRAGKESGKPPSWPPEHLVMLARIFLERKRPDLAMALIISVEQFHSSADISALRLKIKTEQDKLVGLTHAQAFTRDLLVVCPIYINSNEKVALLNFWRTALDRFNPGLDWLMVDDGSPETLIESAGFGPDVARITLSGEDPEAISLVSPRTLASFRRNIGHYLTHGNDGGARSMATGMKTALANRYRCLAILEMDVYTRLDLRELAKFMQTSGVKAITARVKPWNFIESGFMVLDTSHLAAIRCADRWPWQNTSLIPQIEWVCEAILGEVTIMPWTGGRNDFDRFDSQTIATLDYVTHCKDFDLYRRYIQGTTDEIVTIYGRGARLFQQGHFDEALAEYEQVLALKPDEINALNARGLALEQLNRLDEALSCYEKILSIAPYTAEVLCNRGNVLGKLKRFEEALTSYDEALSTCPDYATALNNRAWVLQELQRFEEAQASYDRSLALKSTAH